MGVGEKLYFNRSINKHVADYGDTIVTSKDEYLVIDTSLTNGKDYGLVSKRDYHLIETYKNTDSFCLDGEIRANEYVTAIFPRD